MNQVGKLINMTIQEKTAELKKCLFCSGDIKFTNRRKTTYSKKKYCSHKCYLDYLRKNGNSIISTHNMSGTRPWYIYANMRQRCKDFYNHRYGGRGITVCKEWETFDGFWKDMKDTYKDNLSIDRIDNDGNYCKENCRWSTMKEQQNNRSSNVVLKFNNQEKTLTEWAAEIGVKRGTLSCRYRKGWSTERILTKLTNKTNDNTREII